MTFKFSDKGRIGIAESFAASVTDSQLSDYIVKAETAISELVYIKMQRELAGKATKELRAALKQMRTAADKMISVFERHSVLSQGHPFHSIAIGVQQDLSPERLARYDGGSLERQKQIRRPPQTLQTIMLVNLRWAFLLATTEEPSRCWKVIRATLCAYMKQRTREMPVLTLTDDAQRRVRAAVSSVTGGRKVKKRNT
jgi:hypothetical protein